MGKYRCGNEDGIESVKYPTMEGSAIYRIRVRCALDPNWADRLEGKKIVNHVSIEGGTESVLEGCLVDQSAFAGVLATLYNLHLPVVSVDYLESR
jgi:hypothetical protein